MIKLIDASNNFVLISRKWLLHINVISFQYFFYSKIHLVNFGNTTHNSSLIHSGSIKTVPILYAHIFLSYYLFLMSNIPVKSSIFIEKIVVVRNSKIVRHSMKTCKNLPRYFSNLGRRLAIVAGSSVLGGVSERISQTRKTRR
jgi:hypothetical protein